MVGCLAVGKVVLRADQTAGSWAESLVAMLAKVSVASKVVLMAGQMVCQKADRLAGLLAACLAALLDMPRAG